MMNENVWDFFPQALAKSCYVHSNYVWVYQMVAYNSILAFSSVSVELLSCTVDSNRFGSAAAVKFSSVLCSGDRKLVAVLLSWLVTMGPKWESMAWRLLEYPSLGNRWMSGFHWGKMYLPPVLGLWPPPTRADHQGEVGRVEFDCTNKVIDGKPQRKIWYAIVSSGIHRW